MELWDIYDINRNKTGKTVTRGQKTSSDEYHLIVQVWIMNDEGKFLVSKRSPDKDGWPNMWETTGGSAVAGDDSLKTALKEVSEELGVKLTAKGQVVKSFVIQDRDCPCLVDAWLFKENFPLSDIVLQDGETCDVDWLGQEEILRMIDEGTFIDREFYPYLDEMFARCRVIQNAKACIFDLDGTLTDTIETLTFFGNKALEMHGLPPIESFRYKLFVGDGAVELVRRLLNHLQEIGALGEYDDEFFRELCLCYNKLYNEDFLYKTYVYEGIPELLKNLKDKGLKLAVLSNKIHDTTLLVMRKMFPEGTFDVVFGARDNFPLKPSPQGAFEILNKLSVETHECIYIGDTKTDMQTGKNAGLFTVGVLWGFRDFKELSENNADIIIEKPSELSDYLLC